MSNSEIADKLSDYVWKQERETSGSLDSGVDDLLFSQNV